MNYDELIKELRTEGRKLQSWFDRSDAIEDVLSDCTLAADAIEALFCRFTAPIVCMCGSTKFKQAWISENARLTGEGNIVLAVGLWGHHERVLQSPDVKAKLDDLHKRKIDLCDWVWVLDIGGYIGESTKSEIEYATKLGRPIRYLSKEFPGYVEPVDAVVESLIADKDRLTVIEEEFNAWKTGKRGVEEYLTLQQRYRDRLVEKDRLTTENAMLERDNANLSRQLADITAERDAAIEHLKFFGWCDICVNSNCEDWEEPCKSCHQGRDDNGRIIKCNWQWRGKEPTNEA